MWLQGGIGKNAAAHGLMAIKWIRGRRTRSLPNHGTTVPSFCYSPSGQHDHHLCDLHHACGNLTSSARQSPSCSRTMRNLHYSYPECVDNQDSFTLGYVESHPASPGEIPGRLWHRARQYDNNSLAPSGGSTQMLSQRGYKTPSPRQKPSLHCQG
jgi:hypothetical protein